MGGDTRPLANVRIVVTRAEEQSWELVALLRDRGATVLALPAIEFADPEDSAPIDAAIHSLQEFQWLIFTSRNAVRFFVKRCRLISVNLMELIAGGKFPKVAAIGLATAKSAGIERIPVEIMAKESRGVALSKELAAEVKGQRVLLPRSNRASEDLPRALRAAGAEVTDVIAYRTIDMDLESISPDALESVRTGTADVICFFSPSAFHSIEARVGREALRKSSLAAIGPTTAAAIRDAGLEVAMESREAKTHAFVAALVERFAAVKVARGVRTT